MLAMLYFGFKPSKNFLPEGPLDLRLTELLRQGRLLFPSGANVGWAKELARVIKDQESAVDRYMPNVYAGRTVVFLPSENLGRHVSGADLPILKSIVPNLEICPVPGNHLNMASGKGAEVIAKWYVEKKGEDSRERAVPAGVATI